MICALRSWVLSIGLIVAGVLSASAPAAAHGRLGAAEGRCRLFIGPDIMNFTGYTPDASKSEFCEDIPAIGRMIMVLDDEQDELRDMKVGIRIVRDVGGEEKENENLEAVTVASREPRYYPTGTINFEHNFPESGYFVGIVTVVGDHGERWISRFPFSVGMTFIRTLPVYILLVLGVVAACAEGYPFPTNLDLDPPVGGLAPPSQADTVWQAVSEGWDAERLRRQLRAGAERHRSANRGWKEIPDS